MLNSVRLSSLLASGLCLVASAASATTYSYQKITVPDATGGVNPIAVNASGTVLGSWVDGIYQTHGFIYKAGKITKFDPSGSENTFPSNINASGEVVGTFASSLMQNNAFTYKNGKFTSISLPNKAETILQVAGLNSKGVWLGSAQHGAKQFLFTYTNGKFANVLISNNPTPVAINDSGSFTGYYSGMSTQAFVVIAGKLTKISVPGAETTVPYGFNNSNEVVGQDYTTAGKQKGFLYKNGKATVIDVPGWEASGARAINNSGLIIGNVQHADNKSAVYADNNGVFSILTIPGAKSESATAVNDAGQILFQITNSKDQTEIYLATPKS
jgi:probable HAF family extracellular repeat protein